jgi:hypothetical protein
MRVRLVLALLVAGGLALGSRTTVGAQHAYATECSTDGRNVVALSFDIARARDWAAHFPAERRRSPELETDAPAHVIVFSAPFYGPFGNIYPASVVCVVQDASDPAVRVNLYPDLAIDGVTN